MNTTLAPPVGATLCRRPRFDSPAALVPQYPPHRTLRFPPPRPAQSAHGAEAKLNRDARFQPLRGSFKSVLWAVKRASCWTTWRCVRSIPDIASDAGYSARTVKRALKELNALHLIHYEPKRGRGVKPDILLLWHTWGNPEGAQTVLPFPEKDADEENVPPCQVPPQSSTNERARDNQFQSTTPPVVPILIRDEEGRVVTRDENTARQIIRDICQAQHKTEGAIKLELDRWIPNVLRLIHCHGAKRVLLAKDLLIKRYSDRATRGRPWYDRDVGVLKHFVERYESILKEDDRQKTAKARHNPLSISQIMRPFSEYTEEERRLAGLDRSIAPVMKEETIEQKYARMAREQREENAVLYRQAGLEPPSNS